MFPFRSFHIALSVLTFSLVSRSLHADDHGATVDTPAYKAVIESGWLVSWTNKKTGETIDFGKPENVAALPATYQPGPWVVPGYGQEKMASTWNLEAFSQQDKALVLRQRVEVPDGLAQAVQWSVRLPLDKIDASYWPTSLANRMISADSQQPEGAVGKSYYFENRKAILSSHTWRQQYYVIQGKKGGIIIEVDDPELNNFTALELDDSRFPKDVVLTQRSIAPTPWGKSYQGARWLITQYEGWVNEAAAIRRTHVAQEYDIKPLSERPTAWVQNLAWAWVRAPFTTPPTDFPGSDSPDYTENWEKNLKLVDDWLDNQAKVLEPDKVLFYVNWWRYAAHDTMFPEHSVDPFFAMAVGHARKRGYHVMLHFHNHLVQDAVADFFGRYIQKQDEWHKQAYPNRPNAYGDPEGKIPWGVGFDFLRKMGVIQKDKEFGTSSVARLGLPTKMTGYHMSPAYEGWRYMKVAEILSAIRSTGADAIHIDVPAVWPEGTERFGINSQQGSREFFKLLRKTLDENGLSNVAIATEATPGEGYMKYVDMAQLVRGSSTVSMLDGLTVDTMIELQLGDDLEKAKAIRAAAKARYPNAEEKKVKESLKFDVEGVKERLARIRELSEPNIDAMATAPFFRAYPHLGSSNPLIGGYKDDPAAPIHNQAAQALHIWATLQRNGTFSESSSIQMFFDTPPWDSLPDIKNARKDAIKSRKRLEGKIFNRVSYGEFSLARFWEKNQPRFAPLEQWQKGDIARFVTTDGKQLSVRENIPLVLTLALDGHTLANLKVFGGWTDAEALFRDYGPTFLLNQIDTIAPSP